MHIYNAHSKGTQQKSMVKRALKAEGYTFWAIHSIKSFKCAQKDTFRIFEEYIMYYNINNYQAMVPKSIC